MGGIGALDNAKGMALEQEVIDAYVWENVRVEMTPFEISKNTAALEVIRQVGHGNTFLTNVHTVRNFRREALQRDPAKGRYEATMSKAMVAEARETALRLLKEHEVQPIEKSTLQRGNELIAKWEKGLSPRK